MATTEQLMSQYGVAWFGFDEASGNVYDKLGNDYVGTATGATRTQGWNGKGSAIKATGTNQIVRFNSKLIDSDEFTIRMKLRANLTTIGSYPFSTCDSHNSSNRGFGLSLPVIGGTGAIRTFYWNGTNSTSNSLTIYNAMDNKWHDIVITKNGSNMFAYCDDELQDKITNAVVMSHTHNMMLLNMGQYLGTANRWLNGEIDDLQIYNKALTPPDFEQKRLAVKSESNKNLVLSPTSTRVKEIPNTEEETLLAQGGIIHEIDSAIDRPPIDLTRISNEYEIVSNNKSPLGAGNLFTIPIGNDFKTASIEDND
ncbi:LamG domain-containing protein [Metasolibacillus meyeri]|uniref:LamG domain-containing protein n=1 Tax=Metasolibacillus meyeri TaxID=1071052 RepID=A0AAW9NNY6_9BACL|nr:LamG domain-containing protein [Metasolibacillus meyeri]MEC1179205.1 LamG domain-containing protein [Metasolibacillus meyeri]